MRFDTKKINDSGPSVCYGLLLPAFSIGSGLEFVHRYANTPWRAGAR
jgi:hypothetical protein